MRQPEPSPAAVSERCGRLAISPPGRLSTETVRALEFERGRKPPLDDVTVAREALRARVVARAADHFDGTLQA